MKTKTAFFISQLNELFTGEPWYGKPVMELLEGITPEMAIRKPDSQAHSILEIAAHIAQWQWFVVEKLQGNTGFDIDNNIKDWPLSGKDDPSLWQETKQMIISTKDQIIDELSKKEDTFMDQKVPRRNYNFEYLLQGIIQHDIYHIGQIALLKKMYSIL